MNNYIEYKNQVAFHPGYYIDEIVKESGLTQKDFAKRLGTTPKNLSLLIRGKQSLSSDIAIKLSRFLGTSIEYWLNLQSAYDAFVGKIQSEKELNAEKEILKNLNYSYFRDHFDLPDLPRKIDQQVKELRNLLKISSLTLLTGDDFNVRFRSAKANMTDSNRIKANAMVQLAITQVQKKNVPNYDKEIFQKSVDFALTQTTNHDNFYPILKNKFNEAGIDFIILPNLPGSTINGASMQIGNRIMLLVNDRRLHADTFWFTLFHEIGHIMNNDYGLSINGDNSEIENRANEYAQNKLIPKIDYEAFIKQGEFTLDSILNFSKEINRDPGIIVGRLQKDKIINYGDTRFNKFIKHYKIK